MIIPKVLPKEFISTINNFVATFNRNFFEKLNNKKVFFHQTLCHKETNTKWKENCNIEYKSDPTLPQYKYLPEICKNIQGLVKNDVKYRCILTDNFMEKEMSDEQIVEFKKEIEENPIIFRGCSSIEIQRAICQIIVNITTPSVYYDSSIEDTLKTDPYSYKVMITPKNRPIYYKYGRLEFGCMDLSKNFTEYIEKLKDTYYNQNI